MPTDEAPGAGRRDRVLKAAGLLVLAVIAIAFPQVYSNPSVTNYGVFALIYVTVASAWNIFSGNTGYISLGLAVFYGSGAYALGAAASAWHFTGTSAFALLPFAAVVGAIIAVPFGLIALRVRRHTFIVITIAVFFIFQLMAYNLSFTHGTSRDERAVHHLAGVGLQHALLLHRAGHRGGHDRHRLADPPVPLRPPAARHQGRRGPGARAGRPGPCGSSCRRSSSPARSPR